jgi:hypothetical protein
MRRPAFELDKVSQASLKAEAEARQQLRAVQGGKGVTLNGCKCLPVFKFKGRPSHSCVSDASVGDGEPFCIVQGEFCGTEMPDGSGQRCDQCAIPTKRRCSCTPEWVTNGQTQKGCSEFNSKGKPWCKVREDGCGEVNGDGAWWDYCK